MKFSVRSFGNPQNICIALFLSALSGCGGGGDSASPSTQSSSSSVSEEVLPSLNPYVLSTGMNFGNRMWPDGSTTSGGSGLPIGNVSCLVNENFHVHSHLTIIENGNVLAIPGNVGLQGCAYEVHTHDSSGVIHVETSNYHRITLGDFFSVWGRTLTQTNVADLSAQPINVFVVDNGKLTRYQGDPGDIELISHREITIVLGTVPSQIPTFQWPNNL